MDFVNRRIGRDQETYLAIVEIREQAAQEVIDLNKIIKPKVL